MKKKKQTKGKSAKESKQTKERFFKYIAENTEGIRTEGVKEVRDEGQLVKWIYDSGLKPVAITEILPKKKSRTKLPKWTKKDAADVWNIQAKSISNAKYGKREPGYGEPEPRDHWYDLTRKLIRDLRQRTEKRLKIELPPMPILNTNIDEGFSLLMAYCGTVADILNTPDVPTIDKDNIPLEPDEIVLLQFFCESYPQINYEPNVRELLFPSTNPRNDRTIYRILKSLIQKKLLERPKNSKKGYIISTYGREYYAKHFD